MTSIKSQLSQIEAKSRHQALVSLLLVEDNPADADIVGEMLSLVGDGTDYVVRHVATLAAASALLESEPVDVILLDLRLPDAQGVEAVRAIQSVSPEAPIVVLTGIADEDAALQCIDAGAQDYLAKDELQPLRLRRTIGYAVARLRETQLREMQTVLSHYRALSSSGAHTSVTATVTGVGALRDRDPGFFGDMIEDYTTLLARYIERLTRDSEKPKDIMGRISTAIGDAGGGPRDLLDIHVAALERSVHRIPSERASATVIEGRLLALEMMGLLVDYYRTGSSRRFGARGPK
ncbi:response regulator [Jiella mangrovi]|uniref:Response regulator n=1 Tax=Jiella mangrovi TaxID=2821407 RepID=A0ABS4BN88_9HYPH|nr:response regulator [Jiella mangrovi]MBP0618145.1 response regulator [Jiella mangrovi]